MLTFIAIVVLLLIGYKIGRTRPSLKSRRDGLYVDYSTELNVQERLRITSLITSDN